jgi:predicted dehydrogenase
MNRRTFLEKTSSGMVAAVGGPLFLSGSVLGKNGFVSPNNKITVGFIGTGNNGSNWLQHFFKDERVRVVAVCDVNREGPGYWDNTIRGREPARRMVNQYYRDNSCKTYEDYREVLIQKDIDAIYIGTPDHWHATIAIEAARAGKDIYGQKPLSLTIADGRVMSDTVRNAGIIWQTGSQQRSDFNFRRACELVQNGRIGKLHTVRCGLPGGVPDFGRTAHLTETTPVPKGFNYDMWLGPAPRAPYCPARVGVNFRWNLDYSGGQLTDWGGHHPDIAQWGMDTEYTGPLEIKNARGQFSNHPIYNTATEFYIEFIYANGVKLIISSRERGGVTFEGTEGWVWATRGTHDSHPKSILNTRIGPDEIHLYRSRDHVENFIDCMISRKEPIAPIEVAHRSISLAHLGNIALQIGENLKWDPQKEEFLGNEKANRMLSRPMGNQWQI